MCLQELQWWCITRSSGGSALLWALQGLVRPAAVSSITHTHEVSTATLANFIVKVLKTGMPAWPGARYLRHEAEDALDIKAFAIDWGHPWWLDAKSASSESLSWGHNLSSLAGFPINKSQWEKTQYDGGSCI